MWLRKYGLMACETYGDFRLIERLAIYGLLMLAAYYFHHHSGNSIALDLLYLAVTAGFLKGGINIVEFWLNIREEPVKYRAFTFSQFLLTTLLIIYLVVFQKLGVKGAILGELISYSIFVLISAFMLFRRAMPNLRQVNWRQAFGYCLPVLPHAFFMWGLTGIDRLLLNGSVDRAQIGVYSIGFLLGSFLSIVVRSMRAAWLPAYFKNANGPDSQQQFGKIASIYLFLTFLTALGGMCFAAEVVWLFSLTSAASYSESAKIMQLVLFGFVNMALFIALNQPLLFERRTGLLSMISGFGLAINICLNLLLIPQLGIWGAAIANVSAYLAMTAVTFAATNRIYKIEWESGPLLLTICLFVVFGAVACQFPAEVNMRLIPLKLVLLVAFPLLTLFRFRSSKQALITIESRFAWTQFKPRTFPRSA